MLLFGLVAVSMLMCRLGVANDVLLQVDGWNFTAFSSVTNLPVALLVLGTIGLDRLFMLSLLKHYLDVCNLNLDV